MDEISEDFKDGNRGAHNFWLRLITSGMINVTYTYQAAKKDHLLSEKDLLGLEICYEAYAALLESVVTQHGFTVPSLHSLPEDRDLGLSDILQMGKPDTADFDDFLAGFGFGRMN